MVSIYSVAVPCLFPPYSPYSPVIPPHLPFSHPRYSPASPLQPPPLSSTLRERSEVEVVGQSTSKPAARLQQVRRPISACAARVFALQRTLSAQPKKQLICALQELTKRAEVRRGQWDLDKGNELDGGKQPPVMHPASIPPVPPFPPALTCISHRTTANPSAHRRRQRKDEVRTKTSPSCDRPPRGRVAVTVAGCRHDAHGDGVPCIAIRH